MITRLPEESFDFLGYAVGSFYGKDGRRYIGTRPLRKPVRSLLERIHERASLQWYSDDPLNAATCINSLLWGGCYFKQGPIVEICYFFRNHTERRVRRWLMRRMEEKYRVRPDPGQVSLRDAWSVCSPEASSQPVKSARRRTQKSAYV